MTTIDTKGNIHDTAGRFSEKENSAPAGIAPNEPTMADLSAAVLSAAGDFDKALEGDSGDAEIEAALELKYAALALVERVERGADVPLAGPERDTIGGTPAIAAIDAAATVDGRVELLSWDTQDAIDSGVQSGVWSLSVTDARAFLRELEATIEEAEEAADDHDVEDATRCSNCGDPILDDDMWADRTKMICSSCLHNIARS